MQKNINAFIEVSTEEAMALAGALDDLRVWVWKAHMGGNLQDCNLRVPKFTDGRLEYRDVDRRVHAQFLILVSGKSVESKLKNL